MPDESVGRSQRGFSLIELGIVIAVIAVLAAVVIGSAGYFRAAKERTAVDLVLTIRGAARQFAMRHQNGLRYGNSPTPGPDNVSLKQLSAEGFLPENVKTPWETVSANTIKVGPADLPALQCAGFACIKIEMPVPAEECTAESVLVNRLQENAIGTVTCSGTILTVVMR